MREVVLTELASVLGHVSPTALESNRPFNQLGLDSAGALELRNRLVAATGLPLGKVLLFDYPTPAELAGYVLGEMKGTRIDAQVSSPTVRADEPIAIVGMAARFPGGVSSPEELWQLVAQGVDAIGPLPTDRGWDLENLYNPDPEHPGTSTTRYGGFVRDVGHFDAGFFSISPREALAMDPQQRVLLEAAWEAPRGCRHRPFQLEGHPDRRVRWSDGSDAAHAFTRRTAPRLR